MPNIFQWSLWACETPFTLYRNLYLDAPSKHLASLRLCTLFGPMWQNVWWKTWHFLSHVLLLIPAHFAPKTVFLNKDKQYYCPLGNANTESSSQFPHIFSSHSPGVKSMFILLVCLCHMRLFAYILSVNDSYLKQHPQGCFFTDWLTVYCCGLRLPLSGVL